ncbi:hypothetical protein FDUTEX481_00532 [Tolypothrix sp. PCC 7601]|nr:hypothetical protein FDUTEX481_00532 [Tolypothrix sp. PCC 7601]
MSFAISHEPQVLHQFSLIEQQIKPPKPSSTPRQRKRGKGERFLSLTLFPLTFPQPPPNIFGLADY